MNNIDELIDIVKENGGEYTFNEICDKYQEKYRDSLSQAQRMAIASTLNKYPNLIYLDPISKKWKIVVSRKSKVLKEDSIISKVLSMFDDGQLTINGKEVSKGNKLYRISIPNDDKVCEILLSSTNYKIYSNKELNNLEEYFYQFSKRDNEHRPYQYHVPVSIKTNYLIVCRVAYMNSYNGISGSDKPVNGGAYVAITGDAEEKYNFLNIDGKCYGFVETKHTTKGVNKKLVLENINESFKQKDTAENIKVVFVALNPRTKKTVIVGWYDKATVYRDRQYHTVNGKEHQYNLLCDYENANLIEDGRRTFEIPNASKEGNEFGIGQANVWYIQNNNKALDFEKKMIEYLDNLIL